MIDAPEAKQGPFCYEQSHCVECGSEKSPVKGYAGDVLTFGVMCWNLDCASNRRKADDD